MSDTAPASNAAAKDNADWFDRFILRHACFYPASQAARAARDIARREVETDERAASPLATR